jgi:outer membrane protein assembly factor BamB
VDSKVFVGGGFVSKEVHCLDARTGATRWTVSLGDNGPASPAYHDGVVVYNTESCTTYALDAETGRPLWSAYLGDPLIAMPAVGGGSVLTSHPATRQVRLEYPRFDVSPGSIAGLGPQEAARRLREQAAQWAQRQAKGRGYQLSALDLKTGRPRWSRWIDQQVISAPVIYGEDVYVTTFAGTLYKFRLADGKILIARRCRATSAPVIVGDGIFFTRHAEDYSGGAAAECIAKVDRMTGRPVYSVSRCRAEYLRMAGQPAGSWPIAFVGSAGPTETKTVQGRGIQALQEYSGSRLLAFEGRLFNAMGPEFLCTDPATGERQWSFSLASAGYDGRELAAGPPAVAGGKLFVATLGRELLQVDPVNGSIEKRIPLGVPVVTEPIIDQGRAFLATRNGQLLCVNLGDEQFTGWNQWGGSAGHCGPADAHLPSYRLSQTGR